MVDARWTNLGCWSMFGFQLKLGVNPPLKHRQFCVSSHCVLPVLYLRLALTTYIACIHISDIFTVAILGHG